MFFSKESSMQEKMRILRSLGVNKVVVDSVLWERIATMVAFGTLGVRELDNTISNLFRPIIYNAFGHTSEGELKIDANGNYELSYPCEEKTYKGKSLDFEELED